MKLLEDIFGTSEHISPLHMALRAIVVFIIGLILIRICGRRSFGMRMPMDNVITILLGAILSRAIAGTASFSGSVAAATVIAVLYRFCAWLSIRYPSISWLVKGRVKIIYCEGKFHEENMRYCMISEKDILEGVRQACHQEDLQNIECVYMERSGQISVVKKTPFSAEKTGIME